MDNRILNSVRDITLSIFLSVIGLRYEYVTVHSVHENGFYLLLVSFVCALTAVLSGFLLGRYGFKLNWVVLSSALCDGMTSTTGLGVAVETTGSTMRWEGAEQHIPLCFSGW
jgi:putative transport protein